VDKLNIQNEMSCFDNKDRAFYDSLTDEERKKFSNYLMIRWGSAVEGNRDLQEFYLIATNERLNKHFFAINRHPKLQWLCATSVSPGMGKFRHTWISLKKKDSNDSQVKKQLAKLFPNLKNDDLDVLSKITTKKQLAQYINDHGEA
jgi:hypothetical protein